MNFRLEKCTVLFVIAVLTFFLTVNVARADVLVDNWTELTSAIHAETTPQTITFTSNISGASSALGAQGATNLTINGNNKTLLGNNGGTLYSGITTAVGQTLNIQNINDTGNMATATAGVSGFRGGDEGGFIVNNGTTNIENSYFSGNIATQRGGAIYNDGKLTIDNSKFENNGVENENAVTIYGGAIRNTKDLEIKNSNFINNKVTQTGGAIHSDGNLTIHNSQFKQNSSEKNGGAINYTENKMNILKIDSSTTPENRTTFTSNHSIFSGGAIYISTVSEAKVLTGSINADFIDNYVTNQDGAAYGGAIDIISTIGKSQDDRYRISGKFNRNYVLSNFLNNEHGAYGGAISINPNVASYILVDNATFIDNYALGYDFACGGAIFNDEADLSIENTSFTSNSALGEEVAYGGVIFNNEADLSIKNTGFTGNYASGDESAAGGVIFNNEADLSIENTDFTGNYASGGESAAGGAICLNESGNVTIKDSNFTNNYATGGESAFGGAIANSTHGILTLEANNENVVFLGNAANELPNDIYNDATLNLNTSNDMTITLGGGITGDGNTTINGDVVISDSAEGILQKTVTIETGSLTTQANKLLSAIINGADLKLTSGILNSSISGTGTTYVTGNVRNNASITQNNLTINSDVSFINNVGEQLWIKNELNNSGELTTSLIDFTIGDLETGNNGLITNNLGGIINLDTTGVLAEYDVTVLAPIENNGTINVNGSGEFTINSEITADDNNGILNIQDTASVIAKGNIAQNNITISENASLTLDSEASINAMTFDNYGILTADIKDVTTETFNNNNTLNLTSDNLSKNIAGTGTTVLQNNISIDADRTIEGILNANGKTIDLHQDPLTYQTLTVDSLKGNVDLKIDIDMTKNGNTAAQNDKIYIDDGSMNSGYVNVVSINVAGELDEDYYYADYVPYVTGNTEKLTYKLNGEEPGLAKLIVLTTNKKYTFKNDGRAGYLSVSSQDYTGGLHEYITKNSQSATNFSINEDLMLNDNEDIGITAGTDTTKTVYINHGKTIKAFEGTNGITVANGYTLNLNGSNDDEGLTSVRDFEKALINNGTLNVEDIAFEYNTTDIENNATLNLDGTNLITAGIEGTNGTTNINSGTTTAYSINQKTLNIKNGATLKASPFNITTSTNTISNDGILKLTEGSNSNKIQGTGTTEILGYVPSEATIAQKIINNGDFQINASKIGGAVSNNGRLRLTGGTLTQNVSDSGNSSLLLMNSIVNNANIETDEIVLDGNNITGSGSLILSGGDNIISGQIGTITQTGGLTNRGELKAKVGQIIAPITNLSTLTLLGGIDENNRMTNTSTITDTQEAKTGSLVFEGFVKNDAAIVQKEMTISSESSLENNAMITLRDGESVGTLTNNGTLTSSADNILAAVKNSGTYNILGGTLKNAITETGTINLGSGYTLTLDENGVIGNHQTFNAASNSTLSLIGSTAEVVLNNLVINNAKMNLEIDWGDKFSVTHDAIDSQSSVNLSKIKFASTGGNNGVYKFTNLKNKLVLDKNIEFENSPYTSVKYTYSDEEGGTLSCSTPTLEQAIDETATNPEAIVYSMKGNESAGNKMVESDFIIQGDGNNIANGGIIVGDDGATVANKTLTLKDVGVQNVIVGVDQNGAIHVKNSNKLEIIADKKNINIQGTTGGTNPNAIYLENGAKAKIQANAGRTITISDDIRSNSATNTISLNGLGNIVISGVLDPATIEVSAKTTREAAYTGAGVTLTTYDEGIDWILNAGGSVKYDNDNILYNPAHHTTTARQNTIKFNGGSVDLRNGVASTILLNSDGLDGRVASGTGLILTNDSNIYLDVDLANKKMDNFGTSPVTYTAGTLHVAGMNLISDAAEVLTTINFTTNNDLKGHVDYTGGQNLTALTPIYKYNVNYENTSGNFNFTRSRGSGGYNPAVLASPVAAQVGSYLTQLNNYEQAFGNMDIMMQMTKEQRQAMKFANKYASTQGTAQGGVITFDPNQIPEQQRGAWFRPFATFENVGLKNGPTVGNVAYGSLFGGDSDLIELSNGWDMVWSAYAGYNGSHQTYDGVGIYQNGGTLGASASFYKGNFFTGLTANVGANVGEASTMYGNEDFTMLTTGIASKTGYNWELADGKFIIQPNWLMSYSFINTFDYTNAAGVKINADPLNAIQIAPGVKFIGNLKNGWQPYASVQMVWNIMDKTKFSANDVSLPDLSVKPYVQYGVGLQKRWGERFTGFGQAMIRNGGRNGIALQFGFRWALGKK